MSLQGKTAMAFNKVDHLDQASHILLAPHGLGVTELQRAFDTVFEHQVDFADIYLQSTRQESWWMEDGFVSSGSFSVDRGFGLRALRGDETAFAYSQHIDERQLLNAARSVRSVANHGSSRREIRSEQVKSYGRYDQNDPLSAAEAEEKIALLRKVDRKARSIDPRVSNVMASLELSHSVVMIMRHDGRLAADIRPMLVLQFTVYSAQNGKIESSRGRLGGRLDFGMFDDESLFVEVERVVQSALTNLEAVPAPAGTMPVVIGPGWPGMLLHEAMGHGFEGDFNRIGTSIYSGRLGERVAPKGVTIVDDATLPGRRGSLHIDDEGEVGQCTTLIEDGVLSGYMHDSLSARLMGHAPTGNGRRESYSHLPMPRMTNTFMLPGEYSPEEIIASVKHGLYLADLGSGQVDIVSGQFTFETELAYIIEDGKITYPVRGATVTGNGPQTLQMISMVGNNLTLDNGGATCGKAGQSVPVCVGQPTLKVDELVVGGIS